MGKHEAPKSVARHIEPEKKGRSHQRSRSSAPSFALPDLSGVADKLKSAVKRSGRTVEEPRRREEHVYEFTMQNVLTVAVGSLLFFIASLLPTYGWLRLLIYFVPYLLLGLEVFRDALGELLSKDYFGRNLILTLGTIACFAIGQWQSAVFVMLLYRAALMAEAYVRSVRKAEEPQLRIPLPATARVETGAGLTDSELAAVATGSIVVVEPGEIIPFDGIVADGISGVDVSPLVGASEERSVAAGSTVFAGSINKTNTLRIQVTDEDTACLAAAASRMAQQAADTLPRSGQPLRYAARVLPAVFTVFAVIAGVVVPVFSGEWAKWLYRGALLLCVGGSGSLLLSLSLSCYNAVFRSAEEGAYFRSVDALDALSRAETMVFSKTGTVTEGHYTVEAVYPERYSEKDLLTIAALAECQSMHPIAQALREACGIGIHHREDIHIVEEIPGRGVSTLFSGRSVYVGNAALLMDHGVTFAVPSRTGTVIHVAVDGAYAGHIVLTDKVRDGAFDAVEELRVRGIRSTVMLTGDMRSMARPVASSLNFDLVKCELSPEAKISALEYLQASKGSQAAIAAVSCKTSEAELLSRADVGILFAALEEHRPLDAADITILDRDISRLPSLYAIASGMSGHMRESIIGFFAIKALILVLGFFGVLSIWAAALLDLIATVAVLFNAFRR